MGSPTVQQTDHEFAVLREVEERVLWLSTAIIHHANRVRPNPSGLKVGGHQASSRLDGVDHDGAVVRRSCAPRTGSRSSRTPRRCCTRSTTCSASSTSAYLTTLREFGGLQSYPSRLKDPDPVDYSTGSVGIGATAPIWGAIARRYVDTALGGAGAGRQYSLVGDAELDEGAVWEAVARPDGRRARRGRLDRRPQPAVAGPGRAQHRRRAGCRACSPRPAGRCSRVKYGRLLEELFARPGGAALRRAHRRRCRNPEYQRLLRCTPAELRDAAARRRTATPTPSPASSPTSTTRRCSPAIRNLGGHDLAALRRGVRADRRHPADGHLRLHDQGLRPADRGPSAEPLRAADRRADAELADARSAIDPDAAVARFDADGTAAGRCAGPPRQRLRREPLRPRRRHRPSRPTSAAPRPATATTQAALGRVLLDLTREAPEAARAGGHRQPRRRARRPTSAAG